MGNDLTTKQKKLVDILVSGEAKSDRDAMRKAGYSEATVKTKGQFTVHHPKVQNKVKEIIGRGDFDDKVLGTFSSILEMPLEIFETTQDMATIGRLKLEIIKEINKIQGNYAPQKINTISAKFQFKPPGNS